MPAVSFASRIVTADNNIPLPDSNMRVSYQQFETFISKEGKEIMDLPMFFPETPLLAHTMVFVRSEIDMLKSNP